MKFEDIIEKQSYWTMRGTFPVKMEVVDKRTSKHMIGYDVERVNLWDKIKGTVHSRQPKQIFKTSKELRDFLFPFKHLL